MLTVRNRDVVLVVGIRLGGRGLEGVVVVSPVLCFFGCVLVTMLT
jgi:hypothetical protein